MNELTTLAITSAWQLAKWFWPIAKSGVVEVNKQVQKAMADKLSQKLERLFGGRPPELVAESEDQVIHRAAGNLVNFKGYSDKKLLEEIQLTLINFLSDSSNYILQTSLWRLYRKYVDGSAALALVMAKHALLLNPQDGMAQEIVQHATVSKRLPQLIQDMQDDMRDSLERDAKVTAG